MNRAQGLNTVEVRTKQCMGALKAKLKNTVRQQRRRKAVRTRDGGPVPFEWVSVHLFKVGCEPEK
jgi:hypothetical protein